MGIELNTATLGVRVWHTGHKNNKETQQKQVHWFKNSSFKYIPQNYVVLANITFDVR